MQRTRAIACPLLTVVRALAADARRWVALIPKRDSTKYMSIFIRAILSTTIIFAHCVSDARGQQSQAQEQESEFKIIGQPYDVPEIKVYLTDKETGSPFADRKVYVEYFWGWEVLKHTPEADRMERLKKIMVEARTDEEGMVLIPAKTIIPARPQAPDGAEFSEPTFLFVEVEVQDIDHNCGLFVGNAEDIDKYRAGIISDFHLAVPTWKRSSALRHLTTDCTRRPISESFINHGTRARVMPSVRR